MLSSKSDIALPAASSAAGFSFPEHTEQKRSLGQASIELIVVWPILVTINIRFERERLTMETIKPW